MTKKIVDVGSLKEGKPVVIDGEPCKIVSMRTSSPGKHGSAKARIEAIGIFDGQKRVIIKPVDAKIEVPIIERKTAQVISVMGEMVQLMDLESYETFELPIPEELKGEMEPGASVDYIESLGKRRIERVRKE